MESHTGYHFGVVLFGMATFRLLQTSVTFPIIEFAPLLTSERKVEETWVRCATKEWQPLIQRYMSVPSFDCFRENKSNPRVHLCPSNMWQELLAVDRNPYLPCWICGSIIFFSPPDSIVSYVNWEFAGAAGVKARVVSKVVSGHCHRIIQLSFASSGSGFQHLHTGLLPHLPGWCLLSRYLPLGIIQDPSCQVRFI